MTSTFSFGFSGDDIDIDNDIDIDANDTAENHAIAGNTSTEVNDASSPVFPAERHLLKDWVSFCCQLMSLAEFPSLNTDHL